MNFKYKLGVVGNPIEHSLSPLIHKKFAKNESISIDYQAYKVEKGELNNFAKDFFSHAKAKGLNVTAPLKSEALNLGGVVSDESRHVKAVNTIIKQNKSLILESTDGIGFISDLMSKDISLQNKNVLIIGAGPAVESILYKIISKAPALISIINRTQKKADRLSERYKEGGLVRPFLEDIDYDIVINGSSAGLTGESMETPNINLKQETILYDLNYSLALTPFCRWALNYSDNVFDGTGMLIHQAAHSFNHWFGIQPSTESVFKEIAELKK